MARPAARVSQPVRWLLVLAVAAVVLYATVRPPPSGFGDMGGPLGLVGLDKWLHALGFGCLAAAIAYALVGRGWTAAAVGLAAFSLAVGYGASIEWLQRSIPSHHADAFDVMADAVGAAVALLAWRVAARLRAGPAG